MVFATETEAMAESQVKVERRKRRGPSRFFRSGGGAPFSRPLRVFVLPNHEHHEFWFSQ